MDCVAGLLRAQPLATIRYLVIHHADGPASSYTAVAPSPGGGSTPDVSMLQIALGQVGQTPLDGASAYGNSSSPSMLPPPVSEFLVLPSGFSIISY